MKLTMLEHTLELTVQVFDTDCYGVMWHGAYTKWLEMGRVSLLADQGLAMAKPGEGNIYPVIEQRFQFKQSAFPGDQLRIVTELGLKGLRIICPQTVYRGDTVLLESETTCIVCGSDFKPYRRLPQGFLDLPLKTDNSKLTATHG